MSVLLSCLQLKRDAITVCIMMLMLMLDDASSSNE